METNSLTFLTNELYLRQSELFGDDYKNLENNSTHTFNELSISNLEDWQNSILQKHPILNELQIENLQNLLISLSKILETINPEKLKINEDFLLEESDLLLWRESYKGISKLFFNEYGNITYVFNGNDGKKIRGVFNNNVDYEKLIYKFLSL
ncbi:hypothetical protein [Flavobacterium yafengii]|uniref:hypothetical protein n=1 Tax=Flavobacterium yafengii TaxID=3041253 RepID=UPI0024A90FF3|nr:hypothetical protein [Flavobacterium yafengii]MDI6045654.1 hypothetical protein [Flavobacterium yafengii]